MWNSSSFLPSLSSGPFQPVGLCKMPRRAVQRPALIADLPPSGKLSIQASEGVWRSRNLQPWGRGWCGGSSTAPRWRWRWFEAGIQLQPSPESDYVLPRPWSSAEPSYRTHPYLITGINAQNMVCCFNVHLYI